MTKELEITIDLKIIKDRLDYWMSSRGAYILSPKYQDELTEVVLYGKADTMCDVDKAMEEFHTRQEK